MKVLFFSHQSGFIYGGEVATLAFMRELKEQGVSVHLAAPAGIFLERAKEWATVHEVPAVQFSRKVAHLPSLLPALWRSSKVLSRIIREEKVSLVHAMSLKAMAYTALVRDVPVVWHHHDILPESSANHAWLKLFAAGAKKILVPSATSREALARAGVGAEKIEVLSNGLRQEEWSLRSPRKAGKPLQIGFVGELSARKGIDLLPDLISFLEKNGAGSYEFKIVGGELSEPGLAKNLKHQLAKQVASGQVVFLGRSENVREIIPSFDVLWLPSRQEPFGIVLIEAAFSGVPVVAAPVGGIPEVVAHGESGFLAGSLEEMAAAFKRLEDFSEWERVSVAARKFAVERFEMRNLGRRLREIYEEII